MPQLLGIPLQQYDDASPRAYVRAGGVKESAVSVSDEQQPANWKRGARAGVALSIPLFGPLLGIAWDLVSGVWKLIRRGRKRGA